MDMRMSQESAKAAALEAMQNLANVRNRPCLFFGCDPIGRIDVFPLRAILSQCPGEQLDVVVRSPGGDPHAAYLMVREIHRFFDEVAVYVPLEAKSAATLLCLSADELIMGPLGELGPLDVQFSEKQPGDFPQSRSCLERFKALEQLQRHSIETFNLLVQVALENQMRPLDACNIAAEFTGDLLAPLYSQVEPLKIGQSARYLEIGSYYLERILERYRASLYRRNGREIVNQLVRGYPSHEFIIDVEELYDLEIPCRSPDDNEAPVIAVLETALLEWCEDILFLSQPASSTESRGDSEETENQPVPPNESDGKKLRKLK